MTVVEDHIDPLVDQLLRETDCEAAIGAASQIEDLLRRRPRGVILIALVTALVELVSEQGQGDMPSPVMLAVAVRLMSRMAELGGHHPAPQGVH